MTLVAKSAVALRIFGDELDPDIITELLGSSPSSGRRKGDQRITSSGRTIVAKTGSWILDVDDRAPADLDEQIAEVLGRLSQDLDIWRRLREKFDIDIYVGLFMDESNEDFELSQNAMAQLSARCIRMQVSTYAPAAAESEPIPI